MTGLILNTSLSENAVWIEHFHGKWKVFFYVNGHTTQHMFKKICAANLAERQRLRLLLTGIEGD